MAKVAIRTVVGLVVAVVVALGIGLGATFLPSGTALTHTSSLQTKATSTRILNNSTTSVSSISQCSSTYQNGEPFRINGGSSLLLCVQFFYYNSENTIEVAPADQLTINASTSGGYITSPTELRSAISNFTVTSQPSNFSIGGPSNQNEGITILYDIHAHLSANGSYIMDLGWLAPQVMNCLSEFELVVGNGNPNYYQGGTCYTITQSGGNSGSGYPSNTLFAEVVGSSQSAN